MAYKVGSICSGTLALDMAVAMVFGECELAWVAENDPGAIKIIEERAPGVPNLGDLTKVEWESVEPVDIMCGGWPCQPVSGAGKQKGMKDERWIWPYIAGGIGRMGTPPRLLVLENVPRLLTIDGGAAVAQVTYSLAALGYVGRYGLFRASTAGACHKRERWFCLAVHRASYADDLERAGQRLQQQGRAALAGGGGQAAADTEAADPRRGWRAGSAGPAERQEPGDHGPQPAADTEAAVERWRREGGAELDRHQAVGLEAGSQPGDGDRHAAAHPAGARWQGIGFADWQPAPVQARPGAGPWGGEPAADGGEAVPHAGSQPGEQRWWAERGQAAGGWAPPVGGRSGDGPATAAHPADGGGEARLTEPAPQPWRHDAHRGGDPARGRPAPGGEPHQGGEAAFDPEGERRWLGRGEGVGQRPAGIVGGLGPAQRDEEPGSHPVAADAEREQLRAFQPGGVAGAAGPAEGDGPERERVRPDPGDGHPGDHGRRDDVLEEPGQDELIAEARELLEGLEDFEAWCPDEPGRIHTHSGYCCTVPTFVAGQVEQAIEYGDTDAPEVVAEFDIDWKEYGLAVRRWEYVSGRKAPCPVEPGKLGKPRLSARFAEWMMGLPAGWVTGVPGLTRGQQLKAIGNSVVPLQAAMAIMALYGPVE